MYIFFFKQKTAYERRISDWSSDVCSSDLSKAFIGSQASRGSWLTSPTRRHNGAIGRGCAETPTRHLKFFHPEEAFVCPLSCPDEERTRHGQGCLRAL